MVLMDIKRFILIYIPDDKLLRGWGIMKLCRYPYEGHKIGCPNSLGTDQSCKSFFIDEFAGPPWYFVCAVGDFKKYRSDFAKNLIETGKKKDPSDRYLRNPMYWQRSVRSRLDDFTEECIDLIGEKLEYDGVPEGYGVNVIGTLEDMGFGEDGYPDGIQRRPDEVVWKVNLIYGRKA